MEKMVCQSCGMPMDPEQYGSNQDGTSNSEYCVYCFKDGAFTSDESMENMIEACVPFMEGMTADEARKLLLDTLPNLKRWKKA